MKGRTLLIGASATTVAAVAAALFTVGGPQSARRDRADDARLQDIALIAGTLSCVAADAARPLPDALADLPAAGRCSARAGLMKLRDRETGAPYRYERPGPDAFRICASFHDAQGAEARMRRYFGPGDGWAFDPETGCIIGARQGG